MRVRIAAVTVTAPVAELDLARGKVKMVGGVVVEQRDARLTGESVEMPLSGGPIVIARARGSFRLRDR